MEVEKELHIKVNPLQISKWNRYDSRPTPWTDPYIELNGAQRYCFTHM